MSTIRLSIAAMFIVAVLSSSCASNDALPVPSGMGADGGMDAAMDAAMDAGGDAPQDAADDAAPDTGFDAGMMDRLTCQACDADGDCESGSYCVALTDGSAQVCLPGCTRDLPECPREFQCSEVLPPGTYPTPLCLPVGNNCCVDEDGDGYGDGVSCVGLDCADDNAAVYEGASEACNGVDDDCDTTTDEGEAVVLCPPAAHVAETACVSGACSLISCDPAFDNCNLDEADGCETPLTTLTDCGSCGTVCELPHATATCGAGTCEIAMCDAGWGDCDSDPSNGCELQLNTLSDCGGCGVVCERVNATESCASGSCLLVACDRNYADCDSDAVNGCETDLTTLTDCGACGSTCALSNATSSCGTGSCVISSCNAGWGSCDGIDGNGCETELNSLTHCGSCGTVCALPNASQSCASGSCALISCTAGWGDCDSDPINGCETSLRDNANCGGCGTICAPSGGAGDCSTGTCRVSSCGAGLGDCDADSSNGCETSLRTSTDCGACGLACSRANGSATCASGTCNLTGCNADWGNCDSVDGNGCETSLATTSNCGTCGTVCAFDHASPVCAAGSCAIGSCDAGYDNCDGLASNGCETLLSTRTDCGSCGTVCDLSNASESCASGTCQLVACDRDFDDCNSDPTDGCETSLRTLTSCGSCGSACSLPNATSSCASGTCAVVSCNAGWDDCDGLAANGCETRLDTLTDCGSCGSACSPTSASGDCSSGICRIASCNADFGDCDSDVVNGCETALTSTSNCGACGASCSRSNASATCMTGSCRVSECDALWADCDSSDANGCESPLTTLADCGACGRSCSLPNATATCGSGACEIASCDTGWDDCDGRADNGCETELNTLSHCGGCGASCDLANGSETCSGGTCVLTSCTAGFGNCDASDATGCETSLRSNSDCGMCGRVCAPSGGSGDCSTGTCRVAGCSAGLGDCDSDSSNGCETSLRTNSNCAGCGLSCARSNGSASCSSGSCALTSCNAGWGNCDSVDGNGCETSLNTNADCGSCGSACSLPHATSSCASGACRIVSCDAGWGDCDASDANGCETQLNSLTSCGSCGALCAPSGGGGDCSTGVCRVSSCASGYGNCDGIDSNGCETLLRTSANCGGCGLTCARDNASQSCATGSCVLTSCNSNWGNCDGVDGNGCETPLNTTSNCRGCGTSCSYPNGNATCASSGCALSSCFSGYSNCDGDSSDGCELSHATVSGSCSSSASSVGTYDGDRNCGWPGCGSNTGWDLFSTQRGTTSAWFRGRVREDSSCSTDIEHQIRLEVPDGVDYDLYVYKSCSGSPYARSVGGTGADETVTVRDSDSWGDDDFDYWVEVRFYSGASCAQWTLRFYGHNC